MRQVGYFQRLYRDAWSTEHKVQRTVTAVEPATAVTSFGHEYTGISYVA